jgi:hypothetical protein
MRANRLRQPLHGVRYGSAVKLRLHPPPLRCRVAHIGAGPLNGAKKRNRDRGEIVEWSGLQEILLAASLKDDSSECVSGQPISKTSAFCFFGAHAECSGFGRTHPDSRDTSSPEDAGAWQSTALDLPLGRCNDRLTLRALLFCLDISTSPQGGLSLRLFAMTQPCYPPQGEGMGFRTGFSRDPGQLGSSQRICRCAGNSPCAGNFI